MTQSLFLITGSGWDLDARRDVAEALRALHRKAGHGVLVLDNNGEADVQAIRRALHEKQASVVIAQASKRQGVFEVGLESEAPFRVIDVSGRVTRSRAPVEDAPAAEGLQNGGHDDAAVAAALDQTGRPRGLFRGWPFRGGGK